MTTRVDYTTSYFKYTTPTLIRDKPTNKALNRLKTELRADTSSVESDMSVGDHDFLGLVLTELEYVRVSAAAFITLNFPTALKVPATETSTEAVRLRYRHIESARLYCECKNVGKSLL